MPHKREAGWQEGPVGVAMGAKARNCREPEALACAGSVLVKGEDHGCRRKSCCGPGSGRI